MTDGCHHKVNTGTRSALARTHAPERCNVIWVALGQTSVVAMTNQHAPFLRRRPACLHHRKTLRQKAVNSHESLLLRQLTWRRYRLQATVAVQYDLCSSGVWCSSGWYAIADVSGWTLKVGTDMLFRIVGNQLPTYATSHPGTAPASISIYCKFPLPSPYRNNFFSESTVCGLNNLT